MHPQRNTNVKVAPPLVTTRWILPLAALLLVAVPSSWSRVGTTFQSALGNPDGALTDAASRTKYLIQRDQYHLSYNDDTHQANWVSWSYSTADSGSQQRTDAWAVEELLPSGFLRIGTSTFGTHFGIQWDRGHMTPSADRTLNFTDNAATFRMSNIIPQASVNNQGLWAQFETYCRGLAAGGNEVLLITGPSQFTGNRIPNSMSVPGSVWKIAVIVPNASSPTPANQRITTAARVIAIMTPNVSDGLGTWQSYITSVEEIEEVTNLNFFTAVDPSTAIYLKNLVDTGTGPNNPTVITTFNPTLGAPGTQVTISGFNFSADSTVQFNGLPASSVSVVSPNQLVATVPAGATSGPITADGSGGIDTSYEDFTVTTGSTTPTLSVTPASLTGLTATEGLAGTAAVYGVNGTNLTASVTVTAPANFEISADGTTFVPSLTLTPSINGTLGTQLSVRIRSTAPAGAVAGNITHTSGQVTTQNVSVSGTVTSTSPQITLNPASLSGFSSFQGNAGAAKTYTVSGANLTGTITVTAPAGYEIGLDGNIFAASLTLAPAAGTLAATTIHARLTASAPLGVVSGSISHTGGGATTQNLAVNGSVSDPNAAATRIAAWDFTGESTVATSVAEVFSASLDANNTLTRGPGAAASAGNNSFRTTGFQNNGISTTNTDYFQFAFSTIPGVTLSMNSITARFAGTSTFLASPGVSNQFAYSTNGTDFVLIGTPSVVSSTSSPLTVDVSGISELQNLPDNITVTFRFYASGQTTTGGWGFNSPSAGTYGLDVSARLTGAAAPAPVITVTGPASATALEPFSYQIVANNSPDSYAATGLPDGLSIDTATGLISGTPTTPGTYTVDLIATNEGGDGTATLSLNVDANPDAPSITSNLIANGQINTAFSYQITAANSPASFTAANLPAGLTINTATGVISGTPTTGGTFNTTISALNNFGSDTKTLQIVILDPVLALTPATLQPFTAFAGFISNPQSYTLSGSQLTGSIAVRAPQYFEISTDGSTFAGEISVNPAGDGTISQTITVRLAGTAPPGLINGSISHIGSGATPKYLEISGTVSTADPTITVSAASLPPFTTTAGTASVIQTYEVSGASLTGEITITAPEGFEVGADEESFGPSVIMTPVNGALTATAIYVRLRDDAAQGSYSGDITHAGGGAAVQTVAVSGSVTAAVGPNIIATSGGSAYVSASYSYTIQTDGQQTVTSYGATGLPAGLGVNGSTGLISGTPTEAGTFNVTLSATSSQGTSTKPYTLRVITAGEQPTVATVVINKYHNSTIDRVELLVAGDTVNGPPVDLRGKIIKDFNGNMATDGGGKYVFADHPLWSNVKAGTLVVLAAGNTASEDFDPSDFVLRVNLANGTYFTQESGGFDIGNIDMLMIKPAGMQPDGVAGGMHALAAGTAGSQFNNFTGRKIRSTREVSGGRRFCYVENEDRVLADFYLSTGATTASSRTFGSGNNADNDTFIDTLRALDQDGPVITLLGTDPVNIDRGSSYIDAGATAFDVRDNANRPVTTTGSVDTAVAGTYTLTYTATDTRGNISTATRTVNVLAPASTPPSVNSTSATSVAASTATLNGNVVNAGTSAVSARGFVYSTMDMTLAIGADGVTTLPGGSGTGAFSAAAENLTPGTTYYFRAFATNETGTTYGETLSFTTLKTEPLLHPVDFAAGTITTSRIAATWTAAEADGYLLVVSSGAGSPPIDGVPVTDDTDVSDGSGAINLASGLTSYDGFTGFVPGQSYTFRIYAFNNSGSAIDYKTGSAPSFTAGVLTTPELSVSGSPASLTTTYGTPSSATTFSVSGVYLTSTVSVSAPTGFEVSADNASYASAVTLTPESGSLPATTIYLRLAATAGAAGSYNAQTITISGGGASTVTLATAASGHSVAAKTLNVTGLSASEKIYDGTTAATVVGSPAYEGLVNNESFAVTGSVSWAFADKLVGAGKTLVRTGDFTAPSGNYTIAAQPALTSAITARPLTVTGASVTTRVYDTTTAATITGATLVGVVEGDDVTVSGSGAFSNANAGTNKPVTASLVLGGTDAANYTLTQPSLTGTITKADQTITFAELPAKNLGDSPFNLSGTTTSGLTVSYASSNPAVASVSGSTVTILSVGTTTITATQAGTTNYNAATPVARTLTVIDAPTLIAGWDFQTTTTGGTAAAAIPNTPRSFAANLGTATLHLDGTNGSSQWIVGSSSTTTQLNSFTGTAVNASNGLTTSATSPGDLALVSDTANGQSLVFSFTMTGRANLAVSYAARRSDSGFNSHVWEFSTNGIDWQPLQTINTIASAYAIVALEATNALDNAATAYLRLTVSGASSSGGNTRLDNIQLVAGNYTPRDTTSPTITVLGDNPLTLTVGATFSDPGATALDDIDGVVDVTASGEVNPAVPGSYTITYTATDAAGNTATATRTVNVVDVTAPVISVAGDNPFYLPVGAAFVEPGVSAFDAIDGSVELQTAGTVDTTARGTYTLTYTATDAAGNEATATRTVIVRSGAAHLLETQYGLTGARAALTTDADNDGVPNLMEYAFGTDPSASNSAPAATELVFTGDAVRFSALVRDNDNALRITPLVTTDLRSAWGDTTATEVQTLDQKNVPDGFRRRTWEVSGTEAAALFIRFEVAYD